MSRFRRTFAGMITPLADWPTWFDLATERGCYRRNIDRKGNVTCDERENRELRANLGDTLIVSDARLDVDEVAMVEVIGVFPNGRTERHRVLVVAGELAPVEHRIYVLVARNVLPPKRRGLAYRNVVTGVAGLRMRLAERAAGNGAHAASGGETSLLRELDARGARKTQTWGVEPRVASPSADARGDSFLSGAFPTTLEPRA